MVGFYRHFKAGAGKCRNGADGPDVVRVRAKFRVGNRVLGLG